MGLLTKYFNKYLEDKFPACPIEVDQERCTAVNQYCQETCVYNCPAEAISNGKKIIDESKCHGCGSCVATCPNGALGFKNLKDETLIRNVLHDSKGKTVFRFGCSHSYKYHSKNENFNIDQLASLEVDCLARLYEGILLLPLAAGVAHVWIDTAACVGCRRNDSTLVLARITDNVEGAITWLIQLGNDKNRLVMASDPPDEVIVEAKNLHEKLNNLDRRAFFTHFGNGVKAKTIGIVGDFADHVITDPDRKERMAVKPNERANYPPFHRVVLLAVISKLFLSSQISDQMLSFPEMLIGQQCKLCNICSRLCPTGALEQKKDGKSGRGSIIYRPAKCIHCKKCQDKCFEKQITFANLTSSKKFINQEAIEVYQSELVKCKKCKDLFPLPLAKDELCPICQMSSSNLLNVKL